MVIFHCYVSSSEGRGYPEPSWTCIVDLRFVLNPFPHCQPCGHQEADEYLLQLGLPVRLAEQLWTESCREPKPQDFFLRVAGRTYHIMCFCSFQDCEGCQAWFHGNKYDLHRQVDQGSFLGNWCTSVASVFSFSCPMPLLWTCSRLYIKCKCCM